MGSFGLRQWYRLLDLEKLLNLTNVIPALLDAVRYGKSRYRLRDLAF